MADPRVLAFATKGAGSNEERRIATLVERLDAQIFPFDWDAKYRSFFALVGRVLRERPRLLVMEGTGLAGGLACLTSRLLAGTQYVVSSGDAVGPWVGIRAPLLQPAFAAYERVLCRFAAGFIGWTPYLVGRALTFGVPRAMTAAGWAEFEFDSRAFAAMRTRIREGLGIPSDALTFGIVGSLVWSRRHGYCYGAELVRAVVQTQRKDLRVLIVGGGTGLERLRSLAGADLGRRVFLVGEIPANEVPDYLAAMDVGSLPQSVDSVGSFRYTTKISEYVTARLPVVTSQVPLAYDLDGGWMWRLPGRAPWDDQFVAATAALMGRLTMQEVCDRRAALPSEWDAFNRERQIAIATEFLSDMLRGRASPGRVLR